VTNQLEQMDVTEYSQRQIFTAVKNSTGGTADTIELLMSGQIDDILVENTCRLYFTMGEDGIYYQNGTSQQQIIEE